MIKINRAKVPLKALLQIYLRTAGVALARQHFLTLFVISCSVRKTLQRTL